MLLTRFDLSSQSLDPNDVIPEDFVIKTQDEEVLSQKCPDCYNNVTDDEVCLCHN